MNNNNMDFLLLEEFQAQNPSLQRLLQEQQSPETMTTTRPPVEQACTTLFKDIEEGAAIWQQRPSQTLLSQQFQNTPAINAAHNGIPRGGNTNDILVLAQYGADAQSQENEDLVRSYVVGLFVASIMIMLFFIIWMVLLIVLKGFGPKRVGFLSGKRQKIPPRPNKSNGKSMSAEGKEEEGAKEEEAGASKDEAFANPQDDFEASAKAGEGDDTAAADAEAAADAGDDKADGEDGEVPNPPDALDGDGDDVDIDYTANIVEEQWDAYYHNKITQQRWMKLIVGVCSATIIAMAIIMATRGIESLRGSVKDGSQSINYAGEIMEAAAGSVAGLAAYLEAFQADMVFVLTEVNEICPAVTGTDGGGICQNISDASTCDESFVDEIFGQFIEELELNETALQEIVDVLNTTASTALKAAEDEFGVDVPNEEINDFVNGVVDEVDNINTTDVGNQINEGIDQAVETTSDLFDEASGLISGFNFTNLVETFTQDWPIVDELYQLSDDLYRIKGATNTADEKMSTIDWVFYVAVVFNLLVASLALCLIIGLVLPLPKVLRCLHNRLIFPSLCAFTMLSFIFAIAFLIASLALSDVCYDSPETKLEQIAMAAFEKSSEDLGSTFEQAVSSGDVEAIKNLDWSDYIPQFVTFWLSKCDAEPEGPERDLAQLDEARRWLSAFEVIMKTFLNQAAGTCGTQDPGIYSQIFDTMSGYLCATVSGLFDLQAALSCQTWLPLYYSTVYNAMCYNGTSGVWAIAATQFLTTLMTGFILTFRAVFWELEIEGDEEEEDEEEKKEKSKKSGLFSRFRKNKDDDGVVDEDEKNKNDVDDLALAEDDEEKETAPAIATTNTEEKSV